MNRRGAFNFHELATLETLAYALLVLGGVLGYIVTSGAQVSFCETFEFEMRSVLSKNKRGTLPKKIVR